MNDHCLYSNIHGSLSREDKKEISHEDSLKEEGRKYVKEAISWLLLQDVYTLPLINCNSITLSKKVIKQIELSANEYIKNEKNKKPIALRMQRVPINHVYASDPNVSWSPTYQKDFKLGDRVASLRSDHGIPFGTLGTIVGIHNKFLEILTDKTCIAGNTLHARCSNHRGVLINRNNIINITRPVKWGYNHNLNKN